MSIPGQCPGCGRKFNAPDQYAGKSVRCPQCGQSFALGAAPADPSFAFTPERPAAPSTVTMPANAAPSSRRGLLIGAIAGGAFALLILGAGGLFAVYWFWGGSNSQWKEFASTDGGFRVLLPPGPTRNDKTDPEIAAVGRIREAVAQSPRTQARYSIHYYDLADRPINNYLYLSWLKHHLLSAGGKLATERDISRGPYAGKEIVLDMPDDQVLVRRVYLAEARVFWLTAQYPRSAETPEEAQKFFESFQIGSVPKVASRPSAPSASTPRPTTKKESPPTMTKPASPPTPPQPPPPGPGLVLSHDENSLVAAIQMYRMREKSPPLRLEKVLFEIARADAQNLAEGKPSTNRNDHGFRSVSSLTLQGQNLTPLQLAEHLTKLFGPQVAAKEMQAIGVGMAIAKDGKTHYVFLFGGN